MQMTLVMPAVHDRVKGESKEPSAVSIEPAQKLVGRISDNSKWQDREIPGEGETTTFLFYFNKDSQVL